MTGLSVEVAAAAVRRAPRRGCRAGARGASGAWGAAPWLAGREGTARDGAAGWHKG